MRFASLGSGSQGNALIVEAGATRIMLDCGFGVRDTVARLERIGLAPADISAIIVTHEHGDHADGVFPFARRHGVPVCMTHGTLVALQDGAPRDADADIASGVEVRIVDSHTVFSIGDVQIRPFTVPHDAREPVQYVLSDGTKRLGVLTDIGCSTAHVEASLSGCDALVLECNHDLDMLMNGSYPPSLKQRVAGRFGHLDNSASAAILAALDRANLKHLIAAHLSQKNNTPALARAALAVVMGCNADEVSVASQEEGFDWRDL